MSGENNTILHFSLRGLLPETDRLVVNVRLCTLAFLAMPEGQPAMMGEHQFTASEMAVLKPLLETYPDYCPYEYLLVSGLRGHVTEPALAQMRLQLQEARERGAEEFARALGPMRSALSRVRLKLRSYGIEIKSITDSGYILSQASLFTSVETGEPSPTHP